MDKIEVSQRAREAAADLWIAVDDDFVTPSILQEADRYRRGDYDHSPAVQAFARFERENARLVGVLESANTLLTKAVGDIVALNIMAGKRSSKSFTAEYVEAINAIDATLAALKDRTHG